jgi:hypothetical protein
MQGISNFPAPYGLEYGLKETASVSQEGKEIFSSPKSTPLLEPNQPDIEWVPGVLSLSKKSSEI